MVDVSSTVRRLSAPVSGLALTWFVIHIPGEYAYASVWLMPTVASFFAFAAWFALAYRGMDPSNALAGKPSGSDQRWPGHLGMATMFDSIGKACIGAGCLSALIQILTSPTHCSWEFPVAMGVGILIGAKVLAKIPV
ncbi:MAG TPA: hypothetical protein VK519_14855 [Pinirhizobacter sp.]|uniref:hypothetical protein n=1 Tax=Pinirhizobacter sp. TaxID=2950432 RepID=UPI002CF08638|nr:hypothetical protein [Pinirhizobacter sp.]HMH69189.1 hypothetical protein [Pinirhizobacter sp.]